VSGLDERAVAALVTRAQAGDQAAIHALILELQPRVRNLVRYLVRGDDQVDDLAQQSLLVAFERLAQFRGEGRFEAWLDGIALRVTLRGMKRVRLWRARQSDAAEEELPEHPSHDLSRFAERQRAVGGARSTAAQAARRAGDAPRAGHERPRDRRAGADPRRDRAQPPEARHGALARDLRHARGAHLMQRDLPPPLERLDAGPGPARPLSSREAELQAQRVLAGLRRRPARSRMGLWTAAVCLLALGAWASIAALERRAVQPPAQVRRPQPLTAPTATPPPASAPLQLPASDQVRAGTTAAEPPAAVPAPGHGASRDWLELANAARGRREYTRAHALYLQVLRAEPASDEAYAAGVAAADLEREHLGDAKSALARYAAALRARPQGALSEQAHAGRARALSALGEREREAAAWRELLRAHPGSWFAAEARARLRELGLRSAP
jgi:DNA-directed RNA polymerase specialized sigma24 family protein